METKKNNLETTGVWALLGSLGSLALLIFATGNLTVGLIFSVIFAGLGALGGMIASRINETGDRPILGVIFGLIVGALVVFWLLPALGYETITLGIHIGLLIVAGSVAGLFVGLFIGVLDPLGE